MNHKIMSNKIELNYKKTVLKLIQCSKKLKYITLNTTKILFSLSTVGLPLSEEGVEDMSRVCRYFQSRSIRSAQTERHESPCAFLWKVVNVEIMNVHVHVYTYYTHVVSCLR